MIGYIPKSAGAQGEGEGERGREKEGERESGTLACHVSLL